MITAPPPINNTATDYNYGITGIPINDTTTSSGTQETDYTPKPKRKKINWKRAKARKNVVK